MVEIKTVDDFYSKEFGFSVKRYLTYAQIQQIAEAVTSLRSWAERQTCYDMLILLHTTDIGKEEIEKHGHDELLASGVIDCVLGAIKNLDDLDEAIDFMESPRQLFIQALEAVNDGPLGEMLKVYIKNGRNKKQ